jgi:RNA polymerase sigma-B factor
LIERLGVDEHDYELIEFRLALRLAWPVLVERERRVIELRFVDDQTQSETAADIGVSQMHVSRLLTRALAKLRHRIDAA